MAGVMAGVEMGEALGSLTMPLVVAAVSRSLNFSSTCWRSFFLTLSSPWSRC